MNGKRAYLAANNEFRHIFNYAVAELSLEFTITLALGGGHA
jgi:hypothetical protein